MDIDADRCRICFTKIKLPKAKGIYKERQGQVELLYHACYDCHGRLISDSVEFGNPEWPSTQANLEKKYVIKVKGPVKKKSVTKSKTAAKKKTTSKRLTTKKKTTKKRSSKKKK